MPTKQAEEKKDQRDRHEADPYTDRLVVPYLGLQRIEAPENKKAKSHDPNQAGNGHKVLCKLIPLPHSGQTVAPAVPI